MIEIKAEKFSEGVNVESNIHGKSTDVGLEALHIIAVLMSEIKKDSEPTHAAILATLANCPSVLIGDYMGDEYISKGDMN